MEKVLIVAKTHMKDGACVGGITASNKSVRLIPPGRQNHPEDTKLDVGQVWEMEFRPSQIKPPHTEDVIITQQRYTGNVKNMRETLLKRVTPWNGSPEQLFDGLLTLKNRSAYISEHAVCPKVSTGFWLPNISLLQGAAPAHFVIQTKGILLHVKYVGFAPMIERIPANTLVRVSLARWWNKDSSTEKRCYLQISGWYL